MGEKSVHYVQSPNNTNFHGPSFTSHHRSLLDSEMSSVKPLFYKITQTRSTIGLPPKTRANIKTLGLKRINHIVYQTISPSTAHKLARVKELVKIELVSERKTPLQLMNERKFDPGYTLVKKGAIKKL